MGEQTETVTPIGDEEAYKSLSRLARIRDLEHENEGKEDDVDGEKYRVFGAAEIGRVTANVGGKSTGDVVRMADIVRQFRSVIKVEARRKLVTRYAEKTLKVSEFGSTEQIHGLLELMVVKLKFKEKVEVEKKELASELAQCVEWMVHDEAAMGGRAWEVNEFATAFDEWIARLA